MTQSHEAGILNFSDSAHEKRRMERERFFNLAPDIFIVVGFDGVPDQINLAGEKILGWTLEELKARSYLELIHPDDRPGIEQELRKLNEGGATATHEARWLCKNGEYKWLEYSAFPAAEQQLIYVVARDITVRRHAEEQRLQLVHEQAARAHAEERERYYRLMAEAIPQLVWITDARGELQYVNQRWVDYTGLELTQTQDSGWRSAVHPDDLAVTDHAWETALRTGTPFETEFRLRCACDGTYRWHLARGVPLRDAHGHIIQWLGTSTNINDQKRTAEMLRQARDDLEQHVQERTRALSELNAALGKEIAERKRVEREITERNAQLEAANKELETFSYSISHDLRAPLRHINGFSQALLEDYADKLDEQGRNYLDHVRAASRRMAQLIDALLDLSRVTRAEIHRVAVDLSNIAENISDNLRITRRDRRVGFVIQPGLHADGDERLLRIVLENLLGNAWKFTEKHGSAQIEFGALEQDGERIYFVRDDGAGFDMAYSDKLFGPFQRLHGASEFEGNGIGLATVQRIIHRHGGRIWAEAAVEKGATFYFTLGDG
ncbi:MAG: PAS domain-containing protein [Pseudomonadota bacterium]